MRLLLHLAAKDVSHLRVEVVLFLAIVALDSLLFATDAGRSARGALDPSGIAGVIALFLTILLAAQLAQIDSMSRTTAFWRTRPVARSAMAGEKLALGVALLAGWPAVTDSVAALSLGLPFGEVLGTAGVTTLNQLFLVLPAMAIAAFTRDLARFVAAALGAVVLWAVVLWPLVPVAALVLGSVRLMHPSGVARSAPLGWLLAAGTIGALLFWCRHTARRSRWPAMALWLAPVAVAWVSFVWPWDLTRPTPARDGLDALDRSGISLHAMQPLTVGPGVWSRAALVVADDGLPTLWYAPVAVGGLPNGIYVQPTRLVTRAVLADGTTILTDRPEQLMSAGLANPHATPVDPTAAGGPPPDPVPASTASGLPSLASAMAASLGGVTWLTEPGRGDDVQFVPPILAIPSAHDRPYEATSVPVEADVTLDAWRFEPAFRFRARPGDRASGRGATIEVLQVQPWRREAEPDLVVLVRDAGLRLTRRNQNPFAPYSVFALVNPNRREAIAGQLEEPQPMLRHFAWLLPSLVNGVTALSFTVNRPGGDTVMKPRLSDAWLDEAEIVRIDPVYLGSFTRPLQQVVEVPAYRRRGAAADRRRTP